MVRLAESEFVDIMGLEKEAAAAFRGRAEGPSFVQQFPSQGRSSEHNGATDVSEKWRTMATWASVMLRAANQSAPPAGLLNHAKQLRGKLLSSHSWKVGDKTALKDLLDTIAMLDEQRLQDPTCLTYIIKYATARAQHVENRFKSE